ncbi:MAG: MBL fold metallo-hydrolase, partial [Pseudomonadales bacterium]|nr:MBL fold metallo-hydrolase [Pseudomonadales bacterium]
MSQRPPGLEPAEVPEARESALVVLLRRAGSGYEVLLGRRSRRSRFLPGNWAFIGGGMEDADAPARPGAHARCAVRELHEEAGIRLTPESLVSIGVRVTPAFHPLRFRTEFFLAEAGAGLEPRNPPPLPEEIEELVFFGVGELLDGWRTGALRVPPPLPPLLRALESAHRDAPLEALAADLRSVNAREEEVPRIEFQPGYWLVPQRSRTLPPASHTNTWLVGAERFLVVDPASDEPEELAQLERCIRRRADEDGAVPVGILLTHHHEDHVAGAPALAEALGMPILTHPATRPRLPFSHHPALEARLEEGEVLKLGARSLEVLHTPGHAPGHLALLDADAGILVAADLVSGLSTIVVLPGEGDMGAYMRSLERCAALDLRVVLPSHGPPLPPRALGKTLAHRREREARVLDALGEAPARLGAIA